jgi:ribose/xylose/arabinose/galactoside ABC-type transport system permease subunit
MKKLNKKQKSLAVTILGLFSALATALVVVDFETFDWNNKNDLMKLFVIAMPVIGGYFTTIENKDEPNN